MWNTLQLSSLILALACAKWLKADPTVQSNTLAEESQLKDSFKAPIIGSDDEVLQPLFETEADKKDRQISITPFSKEFFSKKYKNNHRSNKKDLNNWHEEFDSLTKMNPVLPVASAKPLVGQTIFVADPVKKKESTSISIIKNDFNFDTPFGKELDDGLDYSIVTAKKIADTKPELVIFDSRTSVSVIPGSIVAGGNQNNVIKPGAVVTGVNQSISIKPGTVIAGGNQNNAIKSEPVISDGNQKYVIKPGSVIVNVNVKPQQISNESENIKPTFNQDINFSSTTTETYPSQPKPKTIKRLDESSIEELSFDPGNLGPKIDLETEINAQFVSSTIIPYFKSGKLLDRKSSYSILFRAYQEFLEEETLHDIELGADQRIIIFGDIHGQFPDFIKVIEKEGLPSNKLKYIFNGDIVDRGAYSIECLLTLLAFKIAEPDNFFVSLGNHETKTVGKLQFHKESVRKYGSEEFFKLAHVLFKSLPVAYLIQNEVFVAHGGVTPYLTLDAIRAIDRIEPDTDEEEIINDLIWSDPSSEAGATESHRGLGYLYGPDVTSDFVINNEISAVIRSHQFMELGFSEQHDGLCITIFSCPNYKGKMKNFGAYIIMDNDLNLSYNLFPAAESRAEYPIVPSDLKVTRNIRRIR